MEKRRVTQNSTTQFTSQCKLFHNFRIPLKLHVENFTPFEEEKKISVENVVSSEDKENQTPNISSQNEFENFSDKSWSLSFNHEGNVITYGPINSLKVYIFLKNIYSILPQPEKTKRNFMVIDLNLDVHFQPDSLFEILNLYIKKNPQAKGNFQKENSLHSKLKKLNLKNGNSTQKCEKLKRDLLKEKAECGHQTN